MMSILFLNGSPDPNGTTASLAAALLAGRDYETIQLPEHRIYPYGSTLEGDEFDWVLDRMKAADTIVIGSPVYWHNLCGAVQKPREKRPPVLGRFPCARFQADPRKWAVRCILCVDQKWAALKTGWILKLMEIISGARFRRGCCVDQQTAEIGKRELHGQYLPVSASVSMRRTAVPRSMFPGSSRPTSSGIYLATIPESARVFSSASSTSCALPHSTALT